MCCVVCVFDVCGEFWVVLGVGLLDGGFLGFNFVLCCGYYEVV